MSAPTVTLTLDLTNVIKLRPEDGPIIVTLPDVVYVVRYAPDKGAPPSIETVVVSYGDLKLEALRG